MIRIWPNEDYQDLLTEAEADPAAKWEYVEGVFIKFGQVKKFDLRIKVWNFTYIIKDTLQDI